jgi:hypothetical protein
MKAAKMQFGRIYGIGLIVLGLVLLAQFVRYMTPPKEVGPTQTETRTVKNTQHLTSSWPGLIGAGSLVAGIALS